ncbi:MAG: triose-phosphate isomerase [Peptoniphilaceae bacterium]
MRKSIIAGNWKMNLNTSDAKKMLEDLVKYELDSNVEAIICPPFTSIDAAGEILKDSSIELGAQNVSEYEDGAYTGEVSTNMLKDLGVSYVIIGHSERRTYFKESNEIVNKKIKRALSQGLKVILCVGEDQETRDANKHEALVKDQVESSLKNIDGNIENIVVAYEPIWAIGTGKTCNSDDAEAMCAFIRKVLGDIYSEEKAENLRVLYGGSVKPNNVVELMAKENIDGALVGGASLKSEDFKNLINYGDLS